MKAITLIIDSDYKNSSLVGLTVYKLAGHFFGPEDAWAIELSVVEAVNNVIRHAYQERSGHDVMVVLRFFENEMGIEIRDSGVSIPEGLIENRDQSVFAFDPSDLNTLPEGGRGIALIKQNMDSVTYETDSKGNIMKMYKLFNRPHCNPGLSQPL